MHISETIKNYVISISILIGGGWTLYSFNAKLEVERAALSLENAREAAKKRPLIDANITVDKYGGVKSSEIVIEITVELFNVGNDDVGVFFDDESFRVGKVEFDDNAGRNFSSRYYSAPIFIGRAENLKPVTGSGVRVAPGQKKNYKAVFKVDREGTYQAVFAARVSENVLKARGLTDSQVKNSKSFYLAEWTYFYLDDMVMNKNTRIGN